VRRIAIGAAMLAGGWHLPAAAQRTAENTVREAEDGFGKSVGSESIGIYASGEVRGFSATEAGNNRIEGVYWDRAAVLSSVITRGSTTRVGLSSFGYPLPAPTGIIDYDLRRTGTDTVVSVQVNSGDYLGTDLAVDAAIPLGDRAGINLDFGLYDDEYVSGAGAWFVSYGGIARVRPVDGVELTGFYGGYTFGDEEQAPTIFTADGRVPQRIARRRFFGQDWADWAGGSYNYGGLAKVTAGDWQVAAGAFRSRFARDEYHTAFYRGVDAAGVGRSFVLAGDDQTTGSRSGELRVSRVIADGPRRHRILASLRARAVAARYGGLATVDLGDAAIGVPDPRARPDFAISARTRDDVRQTSYAIGYEMRWAERLELNLGLTRTDYRKSVAVPGATAAVERDQPWLWNAAVAVLPTERLTLYAATTRGLEESGIAPGNAANPGAALPALRTRQYEAGVRYALPGGWRGTAAVFDIAKPYFDLDRRDGAFRQLGTVTHRGAEASLSGRPVAGLSVVAGAVWLRPRVSGQAVDDGRIGARPIGRTPLFVDASADYQIPGLAGVSIDAHATYEARRTANAANTAALPARAIIDLGGRYRTRIGRVPTLLRLQVRNLADTFGWRVSGGGGYTLLPGRRVTLSVTADF
jgi:iron complex outermembrane receptor protein